MQPSAVTLYMLNKLKSNHLKNMFHGRFYITRSKNISVAKYLLIINNLKSSLPLVLNTHVSCYKVNRKN